MRGSDAGALAALAMSFLILQLFARVVQRRSLRRACDDVVAGRGAAVASIQATIQST